MALVTCIRSIQQPLRQIRINVSALLKKGQKKPFLFQSAFATSVAQPFIVQKNTSVSDVFVSKSEPKLVVSQIKIFINGCLFIFHAIMRCIRYLVIFTPVIGFYLVTAASGKWFEAWSRSLLFAIELAGPVATKLGQWASTRRDLFPADICDILCRLQRRTKPHRWGKTQSIIEEMFHRPISEIFVKIDRVPVGSGCVAQVYKAKLTESAFESLKADNPGNVKESVAVKVLHPGIERKFRVDLFIMKWGAQFLNAIYWPLQWLDLPRCVDEFEKIMLSQVDLRVEAENTNIFNHNFSSNGNVTFAKPLYPFVAEKVLVETYEEGVSIELFYTEEGKASTKKGLADIGANTLLKMIFKDNFVHGDLHPGNMLVRKDYDSNPSPLLIILDCGITTKLTQKDLKDLSDTFKAIILKQGKVVADLFLERSFNKCPNPQLFKQEMEALVMKLRGEKLTLRNTQVGALMNDVFSLMIRHKVRVESQFSSVVLAIAVLEGVGRSLDPDMDLITIARPYVIKEMAREMFDSDKDFLEHFMEDGSLFSPFN